MKHAAKPAAAHENGQSSAASEGEILVVASASTAFVAALGAAP